MINNNVFIQSALGTGKTQLIVNWIKQNFASKNIVYLSARKTFTRSIITRLSDTGIKLVNYEDIDGSIYVGETQ